MSATAIPGVAWPAVGSTPAEVIHREGSLRVLRYAAAPGAVAGAPPLLVVMPVINRWYIVDLTPATSFVRALQQSGLETYLVDWGRPVASDLRLDLSDYVARLLPRCGRPSSPGRAPSVSRSRATASAGRSRPAEPPSRRPLRRPRS